MEDYSGMGLTTEAGNLSMMNTTEPFVQTRNSDVQRALSYSLTATIAVVMVGVGCGVDIRLLKVHFLRPVGIIVGFLCQFLLMPLVAFALANIAQMSDIETLGLLLVGSCPGGTFSNIATYWVDGDLGLSVTMTTVSSTLGLGMMPLLLFIYSYAFSSQLVVPFQTIGITLASLVAPLLIGFAIRFKKPELAKKIIKVLTGVGSIVVLGLVIAALVSYGNALKITTPQLICAVFFPIIGMSFGYGLASLASCFSKLFLSHKQRRTICFETGIQNTQLAGAIIQLSFGFQEIVQVILFPLAYFVSQMIWVVVLVGAYRIYLLRRPKKPDDTSSLENDEKKYRDSTKGESNTAFESDPPSYTDIEAANSSEVEVSKL